MTSTMRKDGVPGGVGGDAARGTLPADFGRVADAAWARMAAATGFLSEDEGRFLALAAAATPAGGAIVEIGSFKGKSTVGLAHVARHYALGPVDAVDPHTSPSETDPDLAEQATSYDDFMANLRSNGLDAQVRVHRAFSRDLARVWSGPIRLLWIDGDHTYRGAKEDLDLFRAHLAPGATVALHDALHHFDGPLRVFVDEMLASDQFGPAGFVGSIAWAQYRPADGARFRAERTKHADRARRLAELFDDPARITGLRKQRYRWHRARLPHGAVDPAAWARLVALDDR